MNHIFGIILIISGIVLSYIGFTDKSILLPIGLGALFVGVLSIRNKKDIDI